MDGAVSASTPLGLVADRYQLRELIGRGGMADVFSATDLVLDRPVAIKMLRDGMDEHTNRVRFAHEASTLAQLSHRGLVKLYDAALEDGQPFIVLELVEGQSLSRRLGQSGPLDVGSAGSLGRQLADALAYAHSRGVVHRDVKPGNVLVEDDGGVKLADFGIARLIGDNVHHTRTGEAIGTAAYLSPEQVTGGPVNGAADIYALGLLLLEALTGEQAYPGSPAEAALARLTRPPVIPSSLPATWRTLLDEMTRLDPEDRPPAYEVSRRLHSDTAHDTAPRVIPLPARLAGDARQDPAATAAEPTAGLWRRAPWLPVAAACALLMALVLAGALVGRSVHPGATPGDHSSQAASPNRQASPGHGRPTAKTRVAARTTRASGSRPRGHARQRRQVAGLHRTTHRAHPAHHPSHGGPGHAKHPRKEHRPKGRPAKPHGPAHQPRH